jgi:hypothetical protein
MKLLNWTLHEEHEIHTGYQSEEKGLFFCKTFEYAPLLGFQYISSTPPDVFPVRLSTHWHLLTQLLTTTEGNYYSSNDFHQSYVYASLYVC